MQATRSGERQSCETAGSVVHSDEQRREEPEQLRAWASAERWAAAISAAKAATTAWTVANFWKASVEFDKTMCEVPQEVGFPRCVFMFVFILVLISLL